jgi:hypothetical protein
MLKLAHLDLAACLLIVQTQIFEVSLEVRVRLVLFVSAASFGILQVLQELPL